MILTLNMVLGIFVFLVFMFMIGSMWLDDNIRFITMIIIETSLLIIAILIIGLGFIHESNKVCDGKVNVIDRSWLDYGVECSNGDIFVYECNIESNKFGGIKKNCGWVER